MDLANGLEHREPGLEASSIGVILEQGFLLKLLVS